MPLTPLLPDIDPSAIIARRQERAISRATFLKHVVHAAEMMPKCDYVLNLCEDRYLFAVGLFAAISRGTITVLPSSGAPKHIADVAAEHTGMHVLCDKNSPALLNLPAIDIDSLLQDADAFVERSLTHTAPPIPMVDANQVIARVYTSGSTGAPKAHQKTFAHLRRIIFAGAERIARITGNRFSVVGTTPIRHMYGLESSVLLPVFSGGELCAETPFFPADVAQCLANLPAPRVLVSTPYHLRKLIESDTPLPPIAAVLSATAPLSENLARRVARQLSCTLLEIYGSTETGQLATRIPCDDTTWETLTGVELRADGSDTWAHGDVYETPQQLNDIVELVGPTRFRLVDRKANIINVAGKRNTLSCLNTALAQLPGVVDAEFFMPQSQPDDDIQRPAAFVVAPAMTAQDLLTALRARIDPVFLPRPLIFVDALPRDGNGKLPAAAMQTLLRRYLPEQA